MDTTTDTIIRISHSPSPVEDCELITIESGDDLTSHEGTLGEARLLATIHGLTHRVVTPDDVTTWTA